MSSNKLPEQNHELAHVLNRINALTKQNEPVRQEVFSDANIPLLTEVYKGELRAIRVDVANELPILNTLTDGSVLSDVSAESYRPLHAEDIDQLLLEMLPLIREEVKKAVQREQANLELSLRTVLETDLVEALRERLQSKFL